MKIVKVLWTARRTNIEVFQMARIMRELMATIRNRQLGFLGHTLRGEGIEKDCLMGMISLTRTRGRQRRNFMDAIEEWTECSTIEEVKTLAEVRAG